MPITWAILTGEYPPQPGGVSDYTKQVANGLAAAGDVVHVFAPPTETTSVPNSNPGEAVVHVHRLPDCFGAAGRAMVNKVWDALPTPRRMLVQYVPHAFGHRAMNVGFTRWVKSIARHESVDVMYHEVAFPREPGQPLRHRLLAWVTRRMAWQVGVNADRIFVSTTSWERSLREIGIKQSIIASPIPTNFAVPTTFRDRRLGPIAGPGRIRVGHFGTYGSLIEPTIRNVVAELAVAEPTWEFVLIGRGGEKCLARLRADHPGVASRIRATGSLNTDALMAELIACDLVVQPFPDGITTRRTSVMASLSLGVPVVTNHGQLTEPFWKTSNAVALADSFQSTQLSDLARTCAADSNRLMKQGIDAARLYHAEFDLSKSIALLRSENGD